VEGAATFLKAAHAGDRVRIDPPPSSFLTKELAQHHGWRSIALTLAIRQLRQIIVVFDKHPARGPSVGAELEAFRMLSDLTTAGPQLKLLVRRDRDQAVKELAKHLDLVWKQFEKTAALDDSLAAGTGAASDRPSLGDAGNGTFGHVSTALLARAGGTLSLTEATTLLGVSRQALHKRIVNGSALGVMVGNEIAVPKLQIAESDGRHQILPGVGAVTKIFKKAEAGPWMALQFLVDPDPNVGRAPIEALREGDERSVVQAARAHLRLDEE